MIEDINDKKKQVIGSIGEMLLAMVLHNNGWQVHRSYIDEGIDFVITKYWCKKCENFSNQLILNQKRGGKTHKCVTNKCEICKEESLDIISKYLQVKSSEGKKNNKNTDVRDFSFHPKIRYDIGNFMFYVWIAIFPNTNISKKNLIELPIIHFYIFKANNVKVFDDIYLDTYQVTDNQKTTLRIKKDGKVLNKGKKYNYNCFNLDFHNNFSALDSLY